jgi:hypothetical protein
MNQLAQDSINLVQAYSLVRLQRSDGISLPAEVLGILWYTVSESPGRSRLSPHLVLPTRSERRRFWADGKAFEFGTLHQAFRYLMRQALEEGRFSEEDPLAFAESMPTPENPEGHLCFPTGCTLPIPDAAEIFIQILVGPREGDERR